MPGLPSHPIMPWRAILGGRPGAVFSFGLKASGGDAPRPGRRFIESLQLFSTRQTSATTQPRHSPRSTTHSS